MRQPCGQVVGHLEGASLRRYPSSWIAQRMGSGSSVAKTSRRDLRYIYGTAGDAERKVRENVVPGASGRDFLSMYWTAGDADAQGRGGAGRGAGFCRHGCAG